MIIIQNASLTFGSQTILRDASCSFSLQDRIGVIGRNGAGKSTLLQILANIQSLDSGTITCNTSKIAYLPQNITLTSKKTILEEALSHSGDVQLEVAGYEEARMKQLLTGLGFNQQQFEQPVAQLSTGWKMRLILAKLLAQEADFYLFDEPTNHLDITAQQWFLSFLQGAPFGFMIVSHERTFLEKSCSHMLEVERGQLTLYTGNFSTYEKEKSLTYQQQKVAYDNQQKEIARKKATIERFRAKPSKARMAQSMLKQLERIELLEPPQADPSTLSIPLHISQRPGRIVVKTQNLTKKFDDKPIFSHLNLQLERGEKAAIIAPNGMGKTTLLKTITRDIPADQGDITFGHNVSWAYFKQDHHEALNEKNSIWEEVRLTPTKRTEREIRSLLGSFLFTGDTIHKKVSVLSGGEKNRLRMVKTLLQEHNVLILDEPTNHLDIPSKRILEKTLSEYAGAILFVSHDIHFINTVATHIFDLTPAGIKKYHGNYDDFLQQKNIHSHQHATTHTNHKATSKSAPPSTPTNQPQENAFIFEKKKKIRSLELKIEKLERKRTKLADKLQEQEYGTTQFEKTAQQLQTCQNELLTHEEEWDLLSEEVIA